MAKWSYFKTDISGPTEAASNTSKPLNFDLKAESLATEVSSKRNLLMPLQQGGVIGIATPAHIGVDASQNIAAFKALTERGFTLKMRGSSPNYRAQNLYSDRELDVMLHYANLTPTDRATELHDMFQDPEIQAIFCLDGGNAALQIWPHLDLKLIAANPKIFVGFSDISVLLSGLNEQCGLVTFHGPLLNWSFAQSHNSKDAQNSCNLLLDYLTAKTQQPFAGQEITKISGQEAVKVEGSITGGNLSRTSTIYKTELLRSVAGKILLLEEEHEEPAKVEELLTGLKSQGAFEEAKAILLGDFSTCNVPGHDNKVIDYVLSSFFNDRSISCPIFKTSAVGHGLLNICLPFGVKASIENGRLNFMESPFFSA